MDCVEKGCSGKVNKENMTIISFGCCGCLESFPCDRCGRLYDKQGDVVDFEDGRAFFIKSEIVAKP